MPGQANNDPYTLLRTRLPQEISDDVVRLIAYNPDAFADFASIETQEDVIAFNQKWGVNSSLTPIYRRVHGYSTREIKSNRYQQSF